MSVFLNEDHVKEAYENVRSDDTQENWMLIKYEGKQVDVTDTGIDYNDFLENLLDYERAYGYVRVETGDEMSRRAKFVFVTWIGTSVSALKKAKVSTDKAFIKNVLNNFTVEILADEKSELKYDKIKEKSMKPGGLAYGTGK